MNWRHSKPSFRAFPCLILISRSCLEEISKAHSCRRKNNCSKCWEMKLMCSDFYKWGNNSAEVGYHLPVLQWEYIRSTVYSLVLLKGHLRRRQRSKIRLKKEMYDKIVKEYMDKRRSLCCDTIVAIKSYYWAFIYLILLCAFVSIMLGFTLFVALCLS